MSGSTGSVGIRAGKAFIIIQAIDQTSTVLNNISAKMMRWGAQMTQMGQKIVSRTILSLLPLAMSASVFADFDDSMKKVEARSTGTAAEMSAIEKMAKLLGATTAFTSRQIGMLQAKLAQKGYNRSQILDMTTGITNLALAAGQGIDLELDATQAADAVSGVLKTWGLAASESNRIADLITATINSSNYTLEELMTSLQYAGPVAAKFNMTLEDTLATLAGMRDINIDASIAGTAFRNMIAYITSSDATTKFNERLKELTGQTVDFADTAGNLRPLPDILFDIGEAVKNLNTIDKGNMIGELLGIRAMVPGLALMDNQNPFYQMIANLKDAEGAAEKTRNKMDSGLGGAFRNTWSAIEAVGLALGEAVSGPLASFLGWFIKVAGSTVEWIENNRRMVLSIVVGTIAFGAFGIALIVTGKLIYILGVAILGLSMIFKTLYLVTMAAVNIFALFRFVMSPLFGLLGELGVLLRLTAGYMIRFSIATMAAIASMYRYVYIYGALIARHFAQLMGIMMVHAARAAFFIFETALFLYYQLGAMILGALTSSLPVLITWSMVILGAVAVIGLALLLLVKAFKSINISLDVFKSMGAYASEVRDNWNDSISDIQARAVDLKNTAIDTFKGIMDAVEGNNFEMALAVGLKGGQLLWEITLDGMESYFLRFAQSILDIWTNVTNGVMLNILKMQKTAGNFLLELAAGDGPFAWLARKALGVDVQEEIARGQAFGGAADPHMDPRNEINAKWDPKIKAQEDKWNKELVDRDQAIKQRIQNRQAKIDGLRNELEDLRIDAFQERIIASWLEKYESRNLPRIATNDLLDRLLTNPLGQGAGNPKAATNIAPTILDAMVKGTAEALRAAQENRFKQMEVNEELKAQQDQLKEQQKANGHLENILEQVQQLIPAGLV